MMSTLRPKSRKHMVANTPAATDDVALANAAEPGRALLRCRHNQAPDFRSWHQADELVRALRRQQLDPKRTSGNSSKAEPACKRRINGAARLLEFEAGESATLEQDRYCRPQARGQAPTDRSAGFLVGLPRFAGCLRMLWW